MSVEPFEVSMAWMTRTALLALLTLAVSRTAPGDEQERTRVTIRGTGSNVGIERTQAPVKRSSFERNAPPAGTLGEAIRLKTSGAEDIVVIAYLRAHQAELPAIIEAGDVAQLRRAGAGRAVVACLASLAAVDIGETGEGYEMAVSYPPGQEAAMESSGYGIGYGYPFYGGYAARRSARVHFPIRRPVVPPVHRMPHRPFPHSGVNVGRWRTE